MNTKPRGPDETARSHTDPGSGAQRLRTQPRQGEDGGKDGAAERAADDVASHMERVYQDAMNRAVPAPRNDDPRTGQRVESAPPPERNNAQPGALRDSAERPRDRQQPPGPQTTTDDHLDIPTLAAEITRLRTRDVDARLAQAATRTSKADPPGGPRKADERQPSRRQAAEQAHSTSRWATSQKAACI